MKRKSLTTITHEFARKHQTLRHVLIAFCTVPAVVFLPIRMAHAAPPSNDDVADATEISSLSFTDQVDTSEATSNMLDPDCYGYGPTVWYSLTADEDERIVVDTIGSNYDTTLCVYASAPEPDNLIVANDDAQGLQSGLVFDAVEGTTYFILVNSFFGGPGGDLVLNVYPEPPPLEIELEIDGTGHVDAKTGEAILSGTVYCSRPVYVELWGDLKQRVLGHLSVEGGFYSWGWCDGQLDWEVVVDPDDFFKGGPAVVEYAAACGGDFLSYDCDEIYDEPVKLNGGGKN